MSSTDESISLLLSMGFDSGSSQQALQICEGNVERAVECLLSGNISAGGTTANSGVTNSSSQLSLVQSDVSQYSNPLGRSACTVIALTLAYNCIGQFNYASPESFIDSTLLTRSINDGIKLYSELRDNNSSGVEHSSVEDILVACSGRDNIIISSLKLFPNSPRQGVLSNSSSNQHMGLEALLTQCQMDSSESYTAVVITKTPETVLVILPTQSAASNSNAKFILIDSHPRPQQLAPHFPTGSYALFHPTLSSLVASLREIFPVTELGDGVPELMQMMYNSFDIYPFQLSRG
ncbi:hypothetical protein QTG54_005501 [Skeletonema marinoi]|uniref:UBA domain-containing protein n=1 Tax=Skeletonema marinoi TaxID=267567 RepID=A0AAD8YCI1_9STRA|nr:hypothetical protein QTG54_005501 [Skeletonema marinoi]